MSHTRHVLAALTALALALPSPAVAQGGAPPPTPPTGTSGGGRGMDPRSMRGMRPDDPRRLELEKQFMDRVEAMVKQRLGLTDEQSVRLREVATRTEEGRRALRRDELAARFGMRRELLAGDRANEARLNELLDQMPRLERRRLELQEQEQRELAKFLSPLQRARYFALQEELRRGMQEVQQRRMGFPNDSGKRPPGSPGTSNGYGRRGGR